MFCNQSIFIQLKDADFYTNGVKGFEAKNTNNWKYETRQLWKKSLFGYDSIQCGAIITWSIFSKVLKNSSHSSPMRARYGVPFASLMFDLCSAIVSAVLNVISSQIWPCYNGTRLWWGKRNIGNEPLSYQYVLITITSLVHSGKTSGYREFITGPMSFYHQFCQYALFSVLIFDILILNMGDQIMWFNIYIVETISWMLMPWLLASPGHQQPWYWLCGIGRSLSCMRKDFIYLCHINVEQWHQM